MGGKNKAERTKNNTRPSNSGRTAELLGNSLPQFSGFHGMKEVGLITPNFSHPCFDFTDAEINTNFQLLFKKLSKKDATTKLKALHEFIESVKSSDVEVIIGILPFWSRIYNVLAIDIDNKVRESTHFAQLEVVQKVKKQFAPYLKQVAAVWFTSQCDTYPPAASAAEVSINKSFKDISSTLTFCNDEILNYIYDSLLIQTPKTICDQKHNTLENAEAKFQRVIIACLQGYSMFLKKISRDSILKSQELHKKIVNDPKFWKYSNESNLVVIRLAWFEVLTSLLQNAPFLIENEQKNVVSSTIGNLDVNDTVLLPVVWQNVLLIISLFKEWWCKGNLDNILSKLWKFLKVGGYGNATTIYPNLLPLLSNLMQIITDEENLHDNFFKHLISGLKLKNVLASKSEFESISTAFIECLQYVLMKNTNNVGLCEKLIKLQLISTLEWCITDELSCHKLFFNKLPTILQFLNKNNEQFSNYFWCNLGSMFEGILIDLKPFDLEKVSLCTSRQLDFFRIMKHQPKSRKKSVRVTFDHNEKTPSNSEEKIGEICNETYLVKLNELAVKLFKNCVKYVCENDSKIVLERLVELLHEFDSNSFYQNISSSNHGNVQILNDWLIRENLHCKNLVDLIFMVFKYMDENEKKNVLENIEKTSNEDILQWALEKSLAHPFNKDEIVKTWLKSEIVSKFLIKTVEREIKDEGSAELRSLLKIAITENENEEFYISSNTISTLLEKLQVPLRKPSEFSDSIDFIASFSAYFSSMIYTENNLLSFGEDFILSLIIFTKDSHQLEISEFLSEDTAWEIRTGWQDALTLLSANLPQEKLHGLLEKIVEIIRESIENCVENTTRISGIFTNILRALHKGKPSEMEFFLVKIFNLSSHLEQRNLISNTCKIGEYFNEKLSSCYEEIQLNFETVDIVKFSKWNNLKVNVIFEKLNEENYDEDDEDDLRIYASFNSFELISELLYDFELESSFLDNFKLVEHWDNLRKFNEISVTKLIEFVEIIDENEKLSIRDLLKEKCYKHSWIWCKTFYNFTVNLCGEDALKNYDQLIENATDDNKILAVHSTQIFAQHLNFDYVSHTFDDLSRIIVLTSLSKCTEIDVQIAEVVNIVENFRNVNENIFNLESIEMEWKLFQFVLETSRLFSKLIEDQFESLSRRQIDLIVISLAEWLPRLVKFHKFEKLQPMFNSATILYKKITHKIESFKLENTNSKLVKEWDDLFAKDIHDSFTKLWINLVNLNTENLFTRTNLVEISKVFNHEFLFVPNAEKWTKLFEKSCGMMKNTPSVLQILASYNTLMRLVPGFINIDMGELDQSTNDEGIITNLIFVKLRKVCVELDQIVTTILDLKIDEENVELEPFTDSFNLTLAYLFIWDVLLSMSKDGSTELRYQYAHTLNYNNEINLLYKLLDNLIKLMPAEVLDSKKRYNFEPFSIRPTIEGKLTLAKIEEMSCWIYSSSLLLFPNRVSNWKHRNDEKYQVIEKITSNHVTPLIVAKEFEAIEQHVTNFKNMKVEVFPSVREVAAIYTIDDAQVMKLVISLPSNYPLNRVEIRCDNEIPKFCQKWLFLLKKCLWFQNGRICDGLSVFNDSLDKKFEGFEPCCICYSVLHGVSCHLPKLTCKTCKKKFHSACLYKWFGTSNNSSCPICRNLF